MKMLSKYLFAGLLLVANAAQALPIQQSGVINVGQAAGGSLSGTAVGDIDLSTYYLRHAAGTEALPGFTPTGDPDTGISASAANNFDISTGGTYRLRLNSTRLLTAVPIQGPAGLTSAVTYGLAADTGSGLWFSGVQPAISRSGTLQTFWTTLGIQHYIASLFEPGTAAAPGVAIRGDSNTGMFSDVADTLKFATNGTLRLTIGATGGITTSSFLSVGGALLASAGAVTAPGIGWAADDDGTGTGWYRSAANEMALASNGAQRALWASTGALSLNTSGAQTVLTLTPGAGVDALAMPNASRISTGNTRLGLGLASTAQISILNAGESAYTSIKADGTIENNSGTLITINDSLSVVGDLRVTMQTPASAAAACTKDTIAADTGFVYVCTATNTWKRAALATW